MSILKLQPAYKDYLWGGTRLKTDFDKNYEGVKLAESWELSCHPNGMSIISNGEQSGKTLSEYIKAHGKKVLGSNCTKFKDFPILIKLIDANDNLSIQVHPDDEYSLKKEGEYGKTEMWYVVDCVEDSYLYYGFSKKISKNEFAERIQNNTLLDVLNKVPVNKGDVFFIEAGTIHAIGKGIVIAEIQQNSNITYRVYDYGRLDANGKSRELHIDKALEVTKCEPTKKNTNSFPHISKCDYFTVDQIYLDGINLKSIKGNITDKTFISILILDGNGIIRNDNEEVHYKKGESFFIPAGNGIYEIEGTCLALITTVG